MEMCLTGRMMGAQEAESAGLVARIVPAADLLEDALKTAATIAGMPPMAAMVNKEMVNLEFETGLAQGILTERRLFQILNVIGRAPSRESVCQNGYIELGAVQLKTQIIQ